MLRLAVMLDDEKAKVGEVTGQRNADPSPHLAVSSEAAISADANSSEAETETGPSGASKSSEPSPVFLFGRVVSLLLALLEPPDRSLVSR
jgi:hypothetical protein